jgi:hypothetical protein
MTNKRISELTELESPADEDVLAIIDVSESDPSEQNKKITVENLLAGIEDGAGGFDVLIVKPEDQVVSDTNTSQNDDHLHFEVGANETWHWIFMASFDSDAEGFRMQYSIPSGVVLQVRTAATNIISSTVSPLTGSVTISTNSANLFTFHRGMLINGPNAGTVQFQFANSNAGSGNAIVKAGTVLMAWKVSPRGELTIRCMSQTASAVTTMMK